MSTCFVHRPSRSTPAMLHAALAAAEQSLDGVATTAPLLVSLRRDRPGGGVELSVLPLASGSHPAAVLAGFTAPASWEAVGCVTAATAHLLDRPSDGAVVAQPVRLGFLLHRDGTSVSSLSGRPQPPGQEGREPPEGRLVDTCRRVLGLPTPAPEQGPEGWWAMMWLDRIFAEVVLEPARRLSWPEVVAMHPFVAAADQLGAVDHHATTAGCSFAARLVEVASALTWSVIRSAVAAGPDPVAHVDPDLAAWLDDGSFARAVMEPYLAVPALLAELAGLLAEGVHAEIVAAVHEWGLG